MSANDIATIWKMPAKTVYWLAHKHGWRRYRDSGKTFYHPDDVLDALG
ncbi:hypothetical protein KBX06_24155 [Micromonospora sp. C31]|nr:hypothetical protein [Micromonospora sp. C31]MBQ1076226.1 hypothetical protein [Micromonospora sp. C31]